MLDNKIYEFLEDKIHPLEELKKDSQALKVEDEVFDHPTLLTIYKLICNGKLQTIDFPISTGKEGNVFMGTWRDMSVAIKIYRISNLTFKSISKYILGDVRFKGIEKNRRKLMYQWTQKEFRNLERMSKVGVCVPKPLAYENNVLIMEYISVDAGPAPTMKTCPPINPKKAADWVFDNMRICFKDAQLIHGDLSEYNILCGDKGYVIIDVSQGVLKNHPIAQELLIRDVNNIARYFNRMGVKLDPSIELKKIIR